MIINTVVIFIDIKQKNQFDLKEKYENNMMKVIHDLKNPFCSILEMVKEKGTPQARILANITSESNDGLSMLENLKIYFKMSHGMEINEEPQTLDIQEYIENLRFTHIKLSQSFENKLVIKHPSMIPNNIKIHSVLVKRIINNFITNAIKHTMGGLISFNQEVVQEIPFPVDGFIEINDKFQRDKNSRQIKFEVTDNGVGINQEDILNIFENKFSDQSGSNWDGTGLGLPICRTICQRLNSVIQYKSSSQNGSVFILYYLIPRICKSNKIEFKKQNSGRRNTIKDEFELFFDNEHSVHDCLEIMVAEDNLGILKSYKRYFDKNKMKQKLFTNGLSCQNQIFKNNCKNCTQLLFTDNQMPQKNGIDLTNDLKKLNINIKVQMISADDIKDNNNQFEGIQQKPMILSEFKKIQNIRSNKNNLIII